MDSYPKGRQSTGLLLGGPLLFDLDLIEKDKPFSLWRIIDSVSIVKELVETMKDRGNYRVVQIMFSGARGIHVMLESTDEMTKSLKIQSTKKSRALKDYYRERFQIARSIGNWCPGWDWKVSADLWRVSRVPWSVHGRSSLRAIILKPPLGPNSIKRQMLDATPFSLDRQLRIRITKTVSLFTFVDGKDYGPYRKGWVTRLPLAVALHLIWMDFAKPREKGPWSAGSWFEKGWQMIFQAGVSNNTMVQTTIGEVGH